MTTARKARTTRTLTQDFEHSPFRVAYDRAEQAYVIVAAENVEGAPHSYYDGSPNGYQRAYNTACELNTDALAMARELAADLADEQADRDAEFQQPEPSPCDCVINPPEPYDVGDDLTIVIALCKTCPRNLVEARAALPAYDLIPGTVTNAAELVEAARAHEHAVNTGMQFLLTFREHPGLWARVWLGLTADERADVLEGVALAGAKPWEIAAMARVGGDNGAPYQTAKAA